MDCGSCSCIAEGVFGNVSSRYLRRIHTALVPTFSDVFALRASKTYSLLLGNGEPCSPTVTICLTSNILCPPPTLGWGEFM